MSIRVTNSKNQNRLVYIFHLKGFCFGYLHRGSHKHFGFGPLALGNNNAATKHNEEPIYKYQFMILKLKNQSDKRARKLNIDLINIKVLRHFPNATIWLYDILQTQNKLHDEGLEFTSLLQRDVVREYERIVNKQNQLQLLLD